MFSRTYQPGMLCAGGQENKDACEGIVYQTENKNKTFLKFAKQTLGKLVYFSQIKTMSVKNLLLHHKIKE